MNKKEKIRLEMKNRLNNQTVLERRKKSTLIQKKLFSKFEFKTSKCIMLYVSKGTGEVETAPIIKKAIKEGKKIVLPITLVKEKRLKPVLFDDSRDSLKKSSYGVYEPIRQKQDIRPVKLKDIDLVIVPGLAFDKKNNRLGRGKGYYDNFLKNLDEDTPKIGLGFDFQVLRKIPTTKNDFSLTKVIHN
ncbi:MAG: 5-formyltetrahydrofolate cyclo-ligase [Candidatus Omnitrophota bacterium]